LLSFIQFVIGPYTDDLGNVLPYAVEGVGVPVDPLAFAGLLGDSLSSASIYIYCLSYIIYGTIFSHANPMEAIIILHCTLSSNKLTWPKLGGIEPQSIGLFTHFLCGWLLDPSIFHWDAIGNGGSKKKVYVDYYIIMQEWW
jgi:hypothetical protein